MKRTLALSAICISLIFSACDRSAETIKEQINTVLDAQAISLDTAHVKDYMDKIQTLQNVESIAKDSLKSYMLEKVNSVFKMQGEE